MVPGIVESIPLIIEIGLTVFKLLGKDKGEKERSDFKSILERAKSILTAMEPLIEREKELVEGGMLADLKPLIQRVEEGNQLVDRIERSDKKKLYKHHNQELQDWINSFEVSLSSAMLGIFAGMASNMEQKKQLLPLRLQKTEMHLHLHFCSFPDHQQLSLEVEDCKIAFGEFIDLGGLDRLLQGPVSVSNDNAEQQESVHLLTEEVKGKEELESVSIDETLDKQQPKRKRIQPSDEEDNKEKELESLGTNKMLKKPKIETRTVLFAVLARDEAGKKIVERSAGRVTGVLNAKRVEQPNQAKDLVIVKATKEFVPEDFKKYLKKELKRKYVDFITEFPYEEEG